MPLFEGICSNPRCGIKRCRQEHYYKTSDSPSQPCDRCGGPTERAPSRFGVIWTGAIDARYNDRGIKGEHLAGHWAYRQKSSKSGNPEPVFIETWQQQRDYCKEEGLINPKEMPRNFTPTEDGKGVANTRGMPGTEI